MKNSVCGIDETVCGPVVAAGCTRTPCRRVLDIDPSTGLRLELTDALLDQGRSAGAVPVAPIVLGAAAGRPITLLPASCCSSPCATSTSRAAIGGSSNTRTWSTAAVTPRRDHPHPLANPWDPKPHRGHKPSRPIQGCCSDSAP